MQLAATSPKRLRKDPILDAICEIRFSGSDNLSTLLPGLLLPKLKDTVSRLERLPTADFPDAFRLLNPTLSHAPLYRLVGDNFAVAIGSNVLSVGLVGQYPGWDVFKPVVLSVWNAALETELLGKIERISVKYTNVFPVQGGEISKVTNAVVKLGSYDVTSTSIQLRVEIQNNDHITVIQIFNPANVTKGDGINFHGLVMDLDTIRVVPAASVASELETLLDEAHFEEKRIFFELLTTETLKSSEPEYD